MIAYSVDTNSSSISKLILSKAQVTPCGKNRLIIPKLELTTILVSSRSISHLSKLFAFINLTLWLDSRVSLTWITNANKVKDVFVANHIVEIQF